MDIPSRAQYNKELNEILDQIYTRAFAVRKMSHAGLAWAAGLSKITVYRLNHRITRYPRFQTVMALAAAVDMQISITLVRKVTQRRSA
jgi:hypothetical protein